MVRPLAGLFITSTLLHLGEDINILVVSVNPIDLDHLKKKISLKH